MDGSTVVCVGTLLRPVGVTGGMAAVSASTSAAIEGLYGFIVAHACQVAAWLVSACALCVILLCMLHCLDTLGLHQLGMLPPATPGIYHN
jgi:hypothetical protein